MRRSSSESSACIALHDQGARRLFCFSSYILKSVGQMLASPNYNLTEGRSE